MIDTFTVRNQKPAPGVTYVTPVPDLIQVIGRNAYYNRIWQVLTTNIDVMCEN